MTKTDLSIRQIASWLILGFLLILLPYIWVEFTAPSGQSFTATLINPDDTSVYLSAIRQGQEGHWLFHFQFSPETIEPKFMYLLYLLIGQISAFLGGSSVVWFHGLRLLFGLTAMLSVLVWVRTALPNQARRQATAWFIIVFGGGFGWLAVIASSIDFKQIPELGISEWGFILPLLATPHFALGLTFIILFFSSLVRVVRSENLRLWLVTAVLGIGVGLVFPYMVPALGLVTGLYLLAKAWQAKHIPWKMWVVGGLALLPLIPFLLYYGYFAQQDTIWAMTHVQDNIIPAPTIWAVLISLGLLAPFAVVGAWLWIKEKEEIFVPLWALSQLLIIYLPLPFSGRFLLGWVVPVGTLAAYGLEQGVLPWLWQKGGETFFSRISATPYATIRRLILILTLPSILLVTMLFTQVAAVRPDYPIFLPEADVKAVAWLAEETTSEDIVLSNYPVGNYLPRQAAAHVFLGQKFLTVNIDEKLTDLHHFWQETTSNENRLAFLDTWNISFVYFGTYEQDLTESIVVPPGTLVYDVDGIRIYDVRQP
jgi:hypothetical protein